MKTYRIETVRLIYCRVGLVEVFDDRAWVHVLFFKVSVIFYYQKYINITKRFYVFVHMNRLYVGW